jgi:hypothetical protein
MYFQFANVIRLLASAVLFLAPASAYSYTGPGAGITAIGSVLALLGGILLAIVGFIWYPLKRFFRNRSGKPQGENPVKQETAEGADTPANK